MPGEPIAFGPFLFRPDNGTLFRDGELMAIGQRSALLLGALLKSRGEVVTKAELMEAAWPGTAIEESNLSVQIAALRKALGPSPHGGEWIVTIPRIGYRFLRETGAPSAGKAETSFFESVVPSLAVLPFLNLGGDREQEYFADGIVDDIISALSRYKSFAVIARNSSFVYKGRAADVRQVAKELSVRYVLEGSVRRAGNRLRIGAQLIEGMSGAHLWAQNFDGPIEGVFDFQDGIVESVAMTVEPEIQSAEIQRSRRERPGSVAAYDIYLRALQKLSTDMAADNAEAHALLTEAIELEPDNALFLALLTYALEHRHTMGWMPFATDDNEKCIEFARRALQHAHGDASVMAYCAMALIQTARDYAWGMATIESAVEANPNSLMVVICAGVAHIHCGSVENALAYFHRAIRLSPGKPGAYMPLLGIAHVQMIRGHHAEAIDWAARSLAHNPSFDPSLWILIAANAQLGHMGEARRFLHQLKKIAPGVTIAKIRAGQPAKDVSRFAAILDGLRLAGLDEG